MKLYEPRRGLYWELGVGEVYFEDGEIVTVLPQDVPPTDGEVVRATDIGGDMNTETHTPGPWFVDWDGKDVAVFAEANSGEPLLNLRSAKNLFDKDACLIAAAPQMYQALKACLGYFDEQWPGMDFGIPQQVRDVLNHAGHSLRPIHGKAGE